MAHPHLKDARESHNAKMRAMTANYGAADPAANIAAPTNRLKGEGPEDSVGFGADSHAPRARADRGSRRPRTVAANPVASYAKGGRVHKGKHRADGGDVDVIETANKDQALSGQNRARGGRTAHKKGSTHVNVIVAPQGAGAPPMAGGAMPPMMPPRPPMAAPPPAMPPPGAMPPGVPGGMPPGVPPAALAAMAGHPPMPGAMPPPGLPVRAKGGRVHADEKQDAALIHKTLKDEGLIRSDKPAKMGIRERAAGGRLPNQKHHLDAGAATGVGRLEKIGEKPKDAGPAQVV